MLHKEPKPMNGLKNMGGFIGYIIGAIIILPLLLIGYNYFFINKNDVSSYIGGYLKNTTEIKISVPSYKKSNLPDDDLYKSKSYTVAMQSKNMGRDGSQKTSMYYRLVLDDNTHKYYKIMMFDIINGFFGAINNNIIYAKVNKEDISNPKNGSKDNPILVFGARGEEKPLRDFTSLNTSPDGTDPIVDTSPDQYKYNAYMYLTYIMTRRDFKARFK